MNKLYSYRIMPVLFSFCSMASCGSDGSLQSVSLERSEPIVAPKLTHNSITVPERRSGNEFTRATDTYGPLIEVDGTREYYVESSINPWSGPWYALADDYLFQGAHSPLQKYDAYAQKVHGIKTAAAEFERKHFYRPEGESWSGRCDAWAIVSVMEPEPKLDHPVVLDGIEFTQGDLKALLTLSYEELDGVEQFGQRYNGDFQSLPSDIYPEQFHKILKIELEQKKRPFIIDKDPGIAVWNAPVYAAYIKIKKSTENPNVLNVETGLRVGQPHDPSMGYESDIQGNVVIELTYDLIGIPLSDGTFRVIYGVWTGLSERHHPDFVWILPQSKSRRSLNSEIRNEIVDEIIKKARLRSPES
jgi:hypothetical protein